MQATTPSSAQAVIPGMRLILYVASALVFISGVQLFVLSEWTDQFFAWTIQPPLTAAFLGAAYWSSCALELAAARERIWARARIGVPAVFTFTLLTLLVTLLHIDRFHLSRPEPLARGAAWAWLIIYALVPILLAALLVVQLRAPGSAPARQAPLPGWLAGVLLVQALVLLPLGALLLVAPQALIGLWPWQLTPLTARAIGAWSVGLGVAVANALWERDLARVRAATISYACFGLLEIVAILRYPGSLSWGGPAAWLFAAFIVSIAAAGLAGWRATRALDAAGPR